MDANNSVDRGAPAEDMKFPTRFAILNDCWFGPNNLSCVYALYPCSCLFFVGELDGKVISHNNAIQYPGHSAYIGSFMVLKEQKVMARRPGTQLGNLLTKVLL